MMTRLKAVDFIPVEGLFTYSRRCEGESGLENEEFFTYNLDSQGIKHNLKVTGFFIYHSAFAFVLGMMLSNQIYNGLENLLK